LERSTEGGETILSTLSLKVLQDTVWMCSGDWKPGERSGMQPGSSVIPAIVLRQHPQQWMTDTPWWKQGRQKGTGQPVRVGTVRIPGLSPNSSQISPRILSCTKVGNPVEKTHVYEAQSVKLFLLRNILPRVDLAWRK
jgi:hypothetical protein